jgi:acetyl esterase/lipase
MGSLITNDLTAKENIVRLGEIALSPDLAEQDNGPNATPADAGKAEANIVRLITPVEADQKGEAISPLASLPLTELPPILRFHRQQDRRREN